jgi:GTP-binding protein Era
VTQGFRSGFAAFVGRPNAGKSTLTNAMVGQKVAITSNKPQTTRHAVRGIVTRPDGQLVLVDTPGLHKPQTLLGHRLNDIVQATLTEVDVVGFCVPVDQPVGPGDKYIAAALSTSSATIIAIVTKIDTAKPNKIGEQLLAVSKLGDFAEIIPVSAKSGEQVQLLEDLIIARMPEGPLMYPDDARTDEPREMMIAELIREASLAGVRDELPHSIAVTVQEMHPREGRPDITEIYATIHLERDSQKGILIGHQGARLRDVGIQARAGIEELLGGRVHLDLHVAVLAEWQRDPKKLDRLGF